MLNMKLLHKLPSKYFLINFFKIIGDSDKTLIQKDTCTPMFIAALFTITKTWKPPKCPLTDEWIKKM